MRLGRADPRNSWQCSAQPRCSTALLCPFPLTRPIERMPVGMRLDPKWPRHSSDLEPNRAEVQKKSRPQPAEVSAQTPFVQLLTKSIQYVKPVKVRFCSSVQSSKMRLQPFPTHEETEGALIMSANSIPSQCAVAFAG